LYEHTKRDKQPKKVEKHCSVPSRRGSIFSRACFHLTANQETTPMATLYWETYCADFEFGSVGCLSFKGSLKYFDLSNK